MRELIVIAGAVACKPGNGGHSWVFLQYLLGFRRLGYETLLLDALNPPSGAPLKDSPQWKYLSRIAAEFDLQGAVCLLDKSGGPPLGMGWAELLAKVRRSRLLLNVMGYIDDPEVLAAAPLKAFLDIDPGFTQIWHDQGLADILKGHDRYLTVGANIGRPQCPIPVCGLDWTPMLPPVVLEQWPMCPGHERPFTSIARWRGAYGPLEFQGQTLGLRVHEFRRFVSLPARSRGRFQIALQIDPSDAADIQMLKQNGWDLIPPGQVAADPASYRRFIQQSQAEFTAAKGIYVQTRSGWFSDRSACYLASGKPVLVQDTGLDGLLPAGKGLLTFSSLEEAAQGVEKILRDYPFHSRRARQLAEEHFDSDRILKRIIENE